MPLAFPDYNVAHTETAGDTFGEAAPTFGTQNTWAGETPGLNTEPEEHEVNKPFDHTDEQSYAPNAWMRSRNLPLSPREDGFNATPEIIPFAGMPSGATTVPGIYQHGPQSRTLALPSRVQDRRVFGAFTAQVENSGKHGLIDYTVPGPSFTGMEPARGIMPNTFRYVPQRWDANFINPDSHIPRGTVAE